MKKFKTLKKKLNKLKLKQRLKRVSPATKFLSIPTLALVVTFAVACGRQDSSGTAGIESSSASLAAAKAVAKAEPSEPVPTLPEWCDQSGGFMHHEALCEVQIKKMYGRNLMVTAEDHWWESDLEVKPNDTIQIVVNGKPRMRLGGDEIAGAVSRPYVVKTEGKIAFQGRNARSKFEVREITAKRCYDEQWQLQVCPRS